MSVKRTNETTLKDNKNAKENLLKFSTAVAVAAKFPQGFHEASHGRDEGTHVSDFETEMEMEKETEILNTKRQEMAGIFALHGEAIEVAAAGGTNHQHLQEKFNKSNYSTSSSSASAAVASSRAQNKAQKPIEMLKIKQQQQHQHQHQQQTVNDLSRSKKLQSSAKQAEDLKASPQHNVIDSSTPPPICLHIHICDSPSASLFQRSPLFWRCCCLCPNTMKLCSPLLRDLIFLLCFIFILLFLILSATFSESYLRHYNATLCNDCAI